MESDTACPLTAMHLNHNLLAKLSIVALLFFSSLITASSQISYSWQHTAVPANSMLWWTDLNSEFLSGDDIVIAQHRYFLSDPEFDHVTTVLLTPTVKRILNEDLNAMPEGAKFNILRAGSEVTAFVHTMNPSNDLGYRTIIDHPDLNGNPDAIFVYSNTFEPENVYNNSITGLRYNGTNWTIVRENFDNLPDESSFNIVIPPPSDKVFVHTSDDANSVAYYTLLDHPDLNDNPAATLFVRHNLGPLSTQHNLNVGVFYQPFLKKWSIFNEDKSTMDEGLLFNVMIPDSDGDGVADHNDACAGYDDNIDRDQDGRPDYCTNSFFGCKYTKVIYEDHLPGEDLSYIADLSVTSNRVINTTADIRFGADNIYLNPGFEVKAGAVFETRSGCTSGAR